MQHDSALQLMGQMLIVAALIAAPLLLANLLVGVVVSILQVVTQVQEMTLTFVPKLIVSVIVLLVFGGWMLGRLETYTHEMFVRAASPVR